jgi:hypothetical protein
MFLSILILSLLQKYKAIEKKETPATSVFLSGNAD